MSEKPQEAREGEPEDLLEQIITRGLEKTHAPARAAAGADAPTEDAPPAPERADSGGGASPANRKTERSAVYLYLFVLFGAAFLLLLLAYFVQQRSNESTISGLRDSMNLSRQELLDEIRVLEEKNAAQNEKLFRLNRELARWMPQYDEDSPEAIDGFFDSYYAAQADLYSWDSFWMLEQFYQLENYEACAAVLLLQMQGQYYPYRTPSAARARQEQIVRAVVALGILDEEYEQHPEDYQDLLTAYSQP